MATAAPGRRTRWLRAKLRNYFPAPEPGAVHSLAHAVAHPDASSDGPLFANPFHLDDLLVFDDETLRELLAPADRGVSLAELATALSTAPRLVRERVMRALPAAERAACAAALRAPPTSATVALARQRLLDSLFWELTYWKTPELYEQLTEGERLHPGIFARLAPDLRGSVVLDAGAGSGRATLACLGAGAAYVYAVEPSPGLLRLLQRKLTSTPERGRVTLMRGRFEAIPLPQNSVDVALSCSAFTAGERQGGDAGLAELRRVTRPGGKIVLIWPRPEDYGWLAERGFTYVALPVPHTMGVRFRSLAAAIRIARRFYARNAAVLRYLLRHRTPDVPFSVIGYNPPHDYCWLTVEK